MWIIITINYITLIIMWIIIMLTSPWHGLSHEQINMEVAVKSTPLISQSNLLLSLRQLTVIDTLYKIYTWSMTSHKHNWQMFASKYLMMNVTSTNILN